MVSEVSRKYGSVRLLCVIYKVLAVLVGLGAIFVAVVGRGMESMVAIIGGSIAVISLFALSEMQQVFVDTEENTREIIRQLQILNGADKIKPEVVQQNLSPYQQSDITTINE